MDGQETRGVSRKKLCVILGGKTDGAHQEIVSKLRSIGHIEVFTPGESDYLLVFCPVVSRVGTDICEALQKVPVHKPIILVVMHHTFKPDKIIAESRRQVDNTNVRLTVDCLFYEGRLLKCQQTLTAWFNVRRFFGVSDSQDQLKESWKKFCVILARQTNGAHQDIVEKLRSSGHTEVSSPEESDYLLVFCPVVSRIGTDICEALWNAPEGKPIILVVMHHTSNPHQITADSRGQVDHPYVRLTVDCLFYEGRLLRSERNDTAWRDIKSFFEVSSFLGNCVIS